MTYQATGKLHKKLETEEKSASFSVRDFVLELTDSKFPQLIKFQLTQDRCALIDDYAEGDEICVDFDLQGREWNDRYFTNLNAWRISKATGKEGTGQNAPDSEISPEPLADDFDDEIPF